MSGAARRCADLLVLGVFGLVSAASPFLVRGVLFLEASASDSVSVSDEDVSESDEEAVSFAAARLAFAGVARERAALDEVDFAGFAASRLPFLPASASLRASESSPLLRPSPEESELVIEADLDLDVDAVSRLEARSSSAAAAAVVVVVAAAAAATAWSASFILRFLSSSCCAAVFG